VTYGCVCHSYLSPFIKPPSSNPNPTTPTHPPPTPTGEALKANITTLGPLVLPVSEQLLFAANFVARKVLGFKKLKSYMPDFSLAFDHICIHTGARAWGAFGARLGCIWGALRLGWCSLSVFHNCAHVSPPSPADPHKTPTHPKPPTPNHPQAVAPWWMPSSRS